MTRTELRSAVRGNLGGRTDKDSDIETGLNLAVQELVKRRAFRSFWSEMDDVTINEGDQSFDLPESTLHVIELRVLQDGNISGAKLRMMLPGDVKKRYPDPSVVPQGQPMIGYREYGKVWLIPPSNAAYTIKGTIVTKPTGYSTDNSENPIWGSDLTQIAFATMYVKRLLGLHQEAAVWEQHFERGYLSDERLDSEKKDVDLALKPFCGREDEDGGDVSGTPWLNPFVRT